MLSDYIKTIPHYLLPKKALTVFAGACANVKTSWIKNYLIRNFIRDYKVNMNEALVEHPEDYSCFNDFFIRQLKPGCRPMADADVVSPVDGCVSEIGAIHKGMLIQAKKRDYTVQDLLACDPDMSAQFEQGRFATLYLSPKDYHRVHMPIAGTLSHTIHVPGKLFSVQPLTARTIPQLFARNERLVMFFDTELGPMAMVMVGATVVGAIGTSWQGDLVRPKTPELLDYTQDQSGPKHLQKGEEVGYFKLGSTVILLFADGKQVEWDSTLKAGESICLGQKLAILTKNT